MELRTLRSGEREAVLELLDGWPMDAHWTGREFFRRYVEDDPTFEDRNFWVAAEETGELVSCVQVFPRLLRLWGEEVPCGGIGSVFTRPDRRREGLAERLLSEAAGAMKERGLEISVLFASRIAWYSKLGWRQLLRQRVVVDVTRALPAGRLSVRPVRLEEDLDALVRMAGSEDLPQGRVARDSKQWRASLLLAGDPDEDFQVAECDDEIVGYARGANVEGSWQVTEWGRLKGREGCLAELLVRLMADCRSPFTVAHVDDPLCTALEEVGAKVSTEVDPDMMLRCLDVDAVASVTPAGTEIFACKSCLRQRLEAMTVGAYLLKPRKALPWGKLTS